VPNAIEAVWRSSPRLIVAIARVTYDIGIAEELAQTSESFLGETILWLINLRKEGLPLRGFGAPAQRIITRAARALWQADALVSALKLWPKEGGLPTYKKPVFRSTIRRRKHLAR
jgi:hypothetical protein